MRDTKFGRVVSIDVSKEAGGHLIGFRIDPVERVCVCACVFVCICMCMSKEAGGHLIGFRIDPVERVCVCVTLCA